MRRTFLEQAQADGWYEGNKQYADEHGNHERQTCLGKSDDIQFCNTTCNKQILSYRRRQEAYAQSNQRKYAEMNRIDSKLYGYRHKNGTQNNNRYAGIKESSYNNIYYKTYAQKHEFAAGH